MPLSCVGRIRLHGAACVLVPLLLLAPAGCSKARDHRSVFPVKGQVFVGKKPAAGAVIWFHSTEGANAKPDTNNPAAEPHPRGIVQADGSFEVSTYGTRDGAPAGRYRLTVFWMKNDAHGDGGVNLLPARYQDPKASLLFCEVKSESTVIPALHLDAK